MVEGYELAVAANTVFNLRNKKAVESAKAIGELLAGNPDPMQDSVTEALQEAAVTRETFSETFDGLVKSAAALLPAHHIFDENEIVFSTSRRYAGPSGQ